MTTEGLSGRRSGLARRGFADFLREPAPRCIRTAELECHHILTTGGCGSDNAQMLCKECHVATESYGQPGVSPPPFDQATKFWALLRSAGQCECTKAHANHGYVSVPTVSLRRS